MKYSNILHSQLAKQIHKANIEAGWWSDLATGESIINTRNRPEMLCLVISEISEASEAYQSDLMDDKIPEFKGFDVELANCAIRLYDTLGAECGEMIFDRAVRVQYESVSRSMGSLLMVHDALMKIVNDVSRALEGYRKSDKERYLSGLWGALGRVYAVVERFGDHDFIEVMNRKRHYNSNRPDHRIENRLKHDGKKC